MDSVMLIWPIATTTGQIMMYNLKSDRQVQYKAAEDTDFRHRYTMPHMAGAGLVMRKEAN